MTTVLWVLFGFGSVAAVCTFAVFAGGALVAWTADMTRLARKDADE